MTTRQFKRTAFCLGVVGLWLALATPAFAATGTCARANQQAYVEGAVSGESIATETCTATLSVT